MEERPLLEQLADFLATQPLAGFGVGTTAGQLLGAVALLVAAYVAGGLIVFLIGRFSRRATHQPEERTPKGLRLAVRATVMVVALVWALRVLGVDVGAVLDTPLFTVGKQGVTVLTVLVAAGMVVAAYVVSRLLQLWLQRAAADARGQEKANLAIISRLLHYLLMIVGIAVALDNLGVNLMALFAVGGVLMIALGFGMQTIAQNFVSGVILLMERAIKPDDVLEVDGRVVRVVTMGIRTTIVRTRDGEELIVPNSAIVQGTVKNFTYRDSHYRLRVSVGVVYGSDMAQVSRVLREAVGKMEWALRDPPPDVLITAFGNHAVEFEVNAWMEDPWAGRKRKSELHDAIWWALEDAGIEIAFPQLDVHFDPPVVEAVRAAAKA